MKKINIASLFFGILFAALGIFILCLQGSNSLVRIVSAADIIFGAVLVVSAFLSKNGEQAGRQPENDFDECFSSSFDEDEPVADAFESNSGFDDDFEDEQPKESIEETARRLSAREFELKTAARRAAEEANAAKEKAIAASEAAKAAENRLITAEERARDLVGAERQNALLHIDRLANEARDLSQEAAIAKQRARKAARHAHDAADEHSRAVDAAAEAMMALEEEEFNSSND